MKKQKNIPALRFPEFSGEWEDKRLVEAGINIIDGDRGSNYPNGTDFSSEGFCLFMNAKNVTKNGFSFAEKSFIAEEKDGELRKGKLKRFDIVLTTRGSVGHIAYYDLSVPFEHLRINSGMVLLRIAKQEISTDYLYKYFTSNWIQKEISKISFGSAQPQLTVGEIAKFKIKFPTFPEQQKIANFLTAVDEKLQALKKKKVLLEQYKKGVMQKIFSQELRFKDENGNDFADWEVKRLGEASRITTGKLDANAMVKDGEYRFYTCAKDYFKIDKWAFDTEALLVSGNGANVGYIHYYKGKFNAYQRTYVMDGFSDEIIYVKYFLDHFLSQRIDGEKKEGNTPYIVMSTLSEMSLNLPTLPEQQKIANFLTSIDEKINQQQSQIEKVSHYKKGLLQQMFC